MTEEGQEIDELELEEQGRLPTPVLQQKQKTSRHHLDRTTPSVGGILLSAPAQLSDRSGKSFNQTSACFSMVALFFLLLFFISSPSNSYESMHTQNCELEYCCLIFFVVTIMTVYVLPDNTCTAETVSECQSSPKVWLLLPFSSFKHFFNVLW